MSPRFWIPTALVLLYLPLSSRWDLALSRSLHDAHPEWGQSTWAKILYDFGALPAFIFSALALIALLGGIYWPPLRAARKGALLFVGVFTLGTGALTHLVLKELWNRPRPRQIVEFGGKKRFRPVYYLNKPAFPPQRSFPSGHVGCGVCFLALERVGYREKRPCLRAAGLIIALVFGGGLSLSRIAQNGHFLSDTLGTYYLLWCVCLVLEQMIYGKEKISAI